MITRFLNYLRDSRAELKLVTWPTRKQVVEYTILILIISAVFAVFLGGLDFVLERVVSRYLL